MTLVRTPLTVLALLLLVLTIAAEAGPVMTDAARADLESIPVQAGGRVRTLDAFARDVVHEITAEHDWEGEQPLATLLRWISDTEAAYVEPIFPIMHEPLRDAIGMGGGDPIRYSMEALINNEPLVAIAEEVQRAQANDQDLTVVQGKTAEVFNRVAVLHGLLTGEDIRIIPPLEGERAWRAIPTVMPDTTNPGATVALAWTGLLEAYKRDNVEMVETSARVLHDELYAWHGEEAISANHLQAELFYRKLDPWTIAKWLYVLAILGAIAAAFVKKPWMEISPRIFLLLGFVVHTAGLGLRWYIAGRAPWSNMYESLITIAWGVVFFGLWKYRGAASKIIAPSAAFVGFSSLFIAGQSYLDPGIDPLVPALQSYWLNIHVIVILLGYASAALAAVFGHIWIVNDVFRPKQARRLMAGLFSAGYRMVQLSVLFLIVGILLGSVWAHEAWGRYWGWDPKETWALITWFYYLGMIHAGFAGWLKDRGLAVMNVAGLLLVLMTYYGVNYFLSGLHTYASGTAYTIPTSAIVFVVVEVGFLVAYGIHRFVKGRGQRALREATA